MTNWLVKVIFAPLPQTKNSRMQFNFSPLLEMRGESTKSVAPVFSVLITIKVCFHVEKGERTQIVRCKCCSIQAEWWRRWWLEVKAVQFICSWDCNKNNKTGCRSLKTLNIRKQSEASGNIFSRYFIVLKKLKSNKFFNIAELVLTKMPQDCLRKQIRFHHAGAKLCPSRRFSRWSAGESNLSWWFSRRSPS